MSLFIENGSFRDISGFVFKSGETVYRQINKCYSGDFNLLNSSKLLELLQSNRQLVNHTEVSLTENLSEDAYCILKPERVPFISYPYEWSFSQLKDAALLTLDIQIESLQKGMVLKDASAYNVQFLEGKPIFIDTLSFEEYKPGVPWGAYGQFCQHFLAPLALMSKTDINLSQLLRIYIDGIPLTLAKNMLPLHVLLNPGLIMHIFLHAIAQKKASNYKITTIHKTNNSVQSKLFNRNSLLSMAGSLRNTVLSLNWKPADTAWANYYSNTNYSSIATDQKVQLVKTVVESLKPATVWDIGANDGKYSRVCASAGAEVLSFDIDPSAVEKNYLQCKSSSETKILPLLVDFTNPSPGVGWENVERKSLTDRGPADLVLALAVIHHLAIGNNVPFGKIASYFKSICRHVLIEFVPKNDAQIKRMLSIRKDVFDWYNEENFLKSFSFQFKFVSKMSIDGTERTCYLFSQH